MTLSSGFGKRDISPPPGGGGEMDLRMLNFWYDRAGRYNEIHDPLFARAAFFESNGEKACVVALDLIGDSVGITARVRDRIRASLGLSPERVMVVCIHAHATPETIALTDHPVAPQWLDYVADNAAAAAADAAADAAPCRLALAEAPLPGVAFNRAARGDDWSARLSDADRARYSMLDETVRVAAFLRDDNAPAAAIFTFSCHPVCVQAQPSISADWPAAALRALEPRRPSLFLNGACGDADPVRMKSFEAVEWVGAQVAGKVEELLSGLSASAAVADASVKAARRALTLRRREVRPLDVLEREVAEVSAAAAHAAPAAPGGRDNAIHEQLFDLSEELALARWPSELDAEVQAIRIGPLLLIGLPAEVVACLGDDIRRALPGRSAWVVGYANGYLGYACPRASYLAGGYETSIGRWARLNPGEAERLRDASISVAKEASS